MGRGKGLAQADPWRMEMRKIMVPGTLFNPNVFRIAVSVKRPCGGCGQQHPGEIAIANSLDACGPLLARYFPTGIMHCRTGEVLNDRGDIVAVLFEDDQAAVTIVRVPMMIAIASYACTQMWGVR